VEIANAAIAFEPLNPVACNADLAAKVMKLVDALEDHDDVQKVYHSAEIDEAVMAKL
jgi:transcriptional/translational regulatory protein YebC/TACO1